MAPGANSSQYERHYTVDGSTLTVRFGDLLESTAEVLVSSDDYLLTMGGGVSGALARAGGSAIAIDAAKAIPRQLGDVVVTTAGALNARYVFHVISIGPLDDSMDPGGAPNGLAAADQLEVIRMAAARCMHLADQLGVDSIAFPAIGSGVAGIDRSVVAAGMAEAIIDWLRRHERSMRVEIHLAAKRWQSEMEYIVFFEELAKRISAPSVGHPARAVEATARGERNGWIDQRRDNILGEARRITALESEIAHASDDTAFTSEIAQARRALQSALDAKPLQLFVSYSHTDQEEAILFMKHLAGLKHGGLALWSDRQIDPGATWEDEISEALEVAEIAVFLITSSFLDSEYCVGKEWKRALERRAAGELTMVPVILKASMWETLVGHLQVLPSGGQAIMSQQKPDDAFLSAVKGIAEVIQQIRSGPALAESGAT